MKQHLRYRVDGSASRIKWLRSEVLRVSVRMEGSDIMREGLGFRV